MTSSGENQKWCTNFENNDLFVDMFDFLRTVHSLNGIFKRVSVYPDGDVKVRIKFFLLPQTKEINYWFIIFQYHNVDKKTLISIAPKPHFPDILFTMDMTKILNITSISKVVFKMRSLPANLEVKISLLNRDRNCQRPLSENSMLFTGDEILQESNSDKDRVYFLELRYTRDN